MVNVLLVFDEQDESMGSFNQSCLEYFEEYFSQRELPVTYVKSSQLNDLTIQLYAEGKEAFVFGAYSHGTEEGTLNNSSSGTYLSTGVNHTHFNNSFVYTVSCHSGHILGDCLIANGCSCFVGYKSLFQYWDGYKCFPDCANHGLFLFIENNSTRTIYERMIQRYNENIDELYNQNYLVASLLAENRDGLVHLGNDITINDLV